jgi:hypothetical protein
VTHSRKQEFKVFCVGVTACLGMAYGLFLGVAGHFIWMLIITLISIAFAFVGVTFISK